MVDYLNHILEAIGRIERYIDDADEASFLENEMIQDAVVRNLEIIGEACHNVDTRFPKFAAAHPDLPLGIAYQMRNAVAHGYFKVDYEIVWTTIQTDIFPLYAQVQQSVTN